MTSQSSIPSGEIALLFTDIEGSTKRWERDAGAMAEIVAKHDALLRQTIANSRGHVFKTIGDAFCASFWNTSDALQAALDAQQALVATQWGEQQLKVRMAIHTGLAEERDDDYFGPTVNRVARLLSAGHGGQVLLSRIAVERLGQSLPEAVTVRDLGERRLKDLTQPERIFQLVSPGLDDVFPPLAVLDARPNNLPVQPTPLLGRQRELNTVRSLMRADHASLDDDMEHLKRALQDRHTRLLTLLGPGGTGKTRLALQAGADLIDDFAHGVWFVDLSTVSDSDTVPAAIFHALQQPEAGGESVEQQLREYLATKELLLVLDNLEHLLTAAQFVSRLSTATTKLKIMVTSRSPLRVAGEQEFAVLPLPVPNLRRLPETRELMAYPSVELFVQRALAVKPDFALTDANAAAVAGICSELDGLPLAIELAASRVRMLSPEAMLPRLDRRMAMLTGGARDQAERQQTLRNTIAWSFDLMPVAHQKLLARLSVFGGGCDFEAAEAVCNRDGTLDLFDGLAALVEHSLLRQEERESDTRFRMLSTIREFATEQLEQSGDSESVREAHAEWFHRFARDAKPHLTGPEREIWTNRLDNEHDNLRDALLWLEQSGSPERAVELVGGIWRYLYFRGHLREGRQWLTSAIAFGDAADPRDLADALDGAGMLAEEQGDLETAKASLRDALELRQLVDDQAGLAGTWINLGILAQFHGNLAGAESAYQAATKYAEQSGNSRAAAIALSNLGDLAIFRGDFAVARDALERGRVQLNLIGDRQAEAMNLLSLADLSVHEADFLSAAAQFEAALADFEELGDTRNTILTQLNLTDAMLHLGDVESAQKLCDSALRAAIELDAPALQTFGLNLQGRLARVRGDLQTARASLSGALSLAISEGNNALIADGIEAMAAVEHESDRPARSAQLLGAANAIRELHQLPLAGGYRPAVESLCATLQRELGEEPYSKEFEAGGSDTAHIVGEFAVRSG